MHSLTWSNNDGFLNQLTGASTKSRNDRRRYVRNRVFAFENRFDVEIVEYQNPKEVQHFHSLYKNVSERNYEIVGYELTNKFFEKAIEHPNWEIIKISLKPEFDSREKREAVAIAVSYKTDSLYSFLVTGIDYSFMEEYNLYPQILWQTIERARKLGLSINMGITASQPKRKFGATVTKKSIFVQNKDTMKDSLVSLIANQELATL